MIYTTRWTEAEIAYLVDHRDATASDLAAHLGRSERAIETMRSRLIQSGEIEARQPETGAHSRYSAAELALLCDATIPTADLARRMGRSHHTIKAVRSRLGVRVRAKT